MYKITLTQKEYINLLVIISYVTDFTIDKKFKKTSQRMYRKVKKADVV